MRLTTRRAALAAAGSLAAGTVAAAALWRKPPDSAVATPIVMAGEPALQGMDALVATDPPRAPAALSFADGGGQTHTLGEFRGGLVLNLWATWCAPCVAELPALAALARAVRPDGILVLPLSIDRGGADWVRRYYADHGVTELGIWVDPHGEATHALGARGVPTTLVIDRQGRERARLEGAADWASEAAVAAVRRLVA